MDKIIVAGSSMFITSLFAHVHAPPNLYNFFFYTEHKINNFEECWGSDNIRTNLLLLYGQKNKNIFKIF